jgi:hypothetical protein
MLAIEQFYEAFAAHGLLDNARVRFMPSGRFAYVDGVYRSRPFDDFTAEVVDATPSFTCPVSLVPGIDQGDELLVRGVNYLVRGVDAPDDRGQIMLKLKLAGT